MAAGWRFSFPHVYHSDDYSPDHYWGRGAFTRAGWVRHNPWVPYRRSSGFTSGLIGGFLGGFWSGGGFGSGSSGGGGGFGGFSGGGGLSVAAARAEVGNEF